MPVDSIAAIRDCMNSLGFRVSDSTEHSTTAKLFNETNKQSGIIDVTFKSNWHSGEGPFLEVGDEIRGFGIRYLQFKPRWVEFTWNPDDKELVVVGNDYKFSLGF